MKITLKNKEFCDKCSELKDLNTLGGHKKCELYGTILLSNSDTALNSMGRGTIERPANCKAENEVEIKPELELKKNG